MMALNKYAGAVLFLFINLAGVANTSFGAWGTTTVDSTGEVGMYTSIAVGTSGAAYISYYDTTNTNLKYATNVSGTWAATMVDGTDTNVGAYTSIDVGTSGAAYISYYYSNNSDLKYATNVSGSWVTTTVDGTDTAVGMYTSIAVGTSGAAYISYYDTTNTNLIYATNVSGSWGTTTVGSSTTDVGQWSSIAVGTSGAVYISYYDSSAQDLMYATNVSGTWGTTTVDGTGTNVGGHSSIDVGTSGAAYISYYDYTNGDLKYATNVSGTWGTTTIDSAGDVGHYTSMAVGTSGAVYISYKDNTNQDLKYATNVSGAWVTTTVDSYDGVSETGYYTSIAVGTSGGVYISYYDMLNKDLRYATNLTTTSSGGGGGGGGEPVKEKLTVSSVNPSSGATGVSVTTEVSATFNMYVNGSTVTTGSFKLSTESGDVEGSVVTNGATITFTPSLSLSYGTKYTATVTTKVQAANWAGTTMESAYSWSFTTEDEIPVTPTPATSPTTPPVATPVLTTTPTDTATPEPTPETTPTPGPLPTATRLPTPSPMPTVTFIPTLPPRPSPPPMPTPTIAASLTPVATPTPWYTGVISGKVEDIKGKAVKSATVKIVNTGTETRKGKETITDADGFFEFTGLAAGEYEVSANKGSSKSASKTVAIKDGEDSEMKITVYTKDWKYNSANGCFYKVIRGNDWNRCNRMAVKEGASLVCIDDDEEQEWLLKRFGGSKMYWIGLTDKGEEGVWEWVDGKEAVYTNWFEGEPNDTYGDEDYAVMNWKSAGRWNDLGRQSKNWSKVEYAIIEAGEDE